eukprot:scaffold1928_cov109-Alexandrium_tamarense.AAC.19
MDHQAPLSLSSKLKYDSILVSSGGYCLQKTKGISMCINRMEGPQTDLRIQPDLLRALPHRRARPPSLPPTGNHHLHQVLVLNLPSSESGYCLQVCVASEFCSVSKEEVLQNWCSVVRSGAHQSVGLIRVEISPSLSIGLTFDRQSYSFAGECLIRRSCMGRHPPTEVTTAICHLVRFV